MDKFDARGLAPECSNCYMIESSGTMYICNKCGYTLCTICFDIKMEEGYNIDKECCSCCK